MKKYSRFLAAALTLVMLAGLTVPASAEEAPPFAKVDGTEVSVLAVLKELVEAATEPVEIEMLEDVELPEGLYFGVPEGKTVVLDMAGKNITVASGYEGRPLVNRGTLTVLGDGTIDSSASRLGGYGAIDNYGTLTVENGTFVGSLYANGAGLRNRPGAEATIEGGTFEGATCAVYNDGKMTVDGGTFSSEACNQLKVDGEAIFSYAFRSYGELYFHDGEVTGVQGALAIGSGYAEVQDGTFTAKRDSHDTNCTFYALYIAGEVDEVEAHIEGGTYVSEGRVALLAGNDNTGGDGGINAKATAYISGGSFTGVGGAMSAGQNTGDPSITGGTFNSDISDYLAQGYTCVQDGPVYTVTGPVASIGGQRYETLAKAIAAVPDGTDEPVTVTLLSDAIGGVKIGSNKNMVLDLGGYALSVDKGVGSTGTETNGIQLLRGSTVTIENGTLKVGKAADINFMIKNYCDLTLRDVVIDGTGMVANGNPAVNNCGQLTLAGDGNVIKNVPQGNYGIATGNYHYQEAIHTVIEGGKIDSVYTEGNAWISSPHEYDGELVKTEIKGGEIGAVGMYTWGDTKPLNWQFVISDAATVEENHFAAKAGTGYYATLADAVAAAEEGGTVTLLNDVSVSSPIAIRKDLTIDGGGHTLTGVTGGSGGSRQGMFHLDNTERAVTFTLKDAELINKKSWSSPSGISVQASDQTVHLDKVTMDTAYYCVIAGVLNGNGSEKMDDITLTIDDSKLTGYAAVYYRTNSTTDTINDPILTVTGSELYGRGVNGYGNGFATIVYNGTRGARTTIADSILSNNFDGGNADADEGVIMFNSYGAYEKDAQVTIRNSTIKTASDSAAPNVIKYVCTQNLNAGNKVIVDHLTLTRGETGTDLIRVLRGGNELVATGVDLKTVLETSVYDDSTWGEGDSVTYHPLLQGDETVQVPMDLTLAENVTIPAGVTVKVQPGAALTVPDGVAVTGGSGSKLIVEGTVSGLAGVGSGTYRWSQDQWVRESSSSGGGGGGSTTKPPKTETETETKGDVTTETKTTTTQNKDGSTTTATEQTSTNASTGEKTEHKVTETVAKDGSTVREETKTTVAADGSKVEEKQLDLTDKTTGTATTAQVVTDGTGRTTATAKTEAQAEVKAGTDGTATASVDAKTAEKLLEQAKQAAEAAKEADHVAHTVVVTAPAPKDGAVTALTVEVPKQTVDALAKETAADVVVETPIASVTVPNEALASLAGTKGEALVVKAEQAGAATVRVTVAVDGTALDQVTGGLKASIPAEQAGAGTVAVLVKADGTEELVRKSVAADGGLTVPLSGSATVKLVENGKVFPDTQSHWAGEAVEFVTARELFQGVSEERFAPNAPMTRGMLVTVLSRLEDEPEAAGTGFQDVSEGAWYAQAVAWAAEAKIVTGVGDGTFAPETAITREQLATFLYRYAGAMGQDTGAKGELEGFTDGAAVSDWAKEAMEYAVGAGILTGKDGKTLDPAGTATRAEVAAVLQRLVVSMA